MLKNILKLDGAQQLSKNEQKEINGGIPEGCAYQTWPLIGASKTACAANRPGGYNYNRYSTNVCIAFFCGGTELGL
jgi:hypothetical protein